MSPLLPFDNYSLTLVSCLYNWKVTGVDTSTFTISRQSVVGLNVFHCIGKVSRTAIKPLWEMGAVCVCLTEI